MGHNDQRVLAAHAALEHCVKQCSERAWRLAYGMMRNSADAADVVQQAFLVAALKPSKIPANDPWPWFGTVVAYTAKNARRKRSRTASEEQAMNVQDGCASDPHSSLECSEEYAALHEALDALDEDERDAVVLTQMSSLPYRDAAKALGVPLGTFNHRVGRGLANLRQRFGVDNTNISRQLTVLPIVAPPGGFDVMAQTWLGMAKTAVSAGASVSGTVIAGGLIMGNKLVAAGLVAAGVIAGFGGSVAYLEMAEKNDRLASSTEATGRADAPRADSATVKENGQNEATVLRKERDNLATLLAAEKERSAEFERRLSTHPQ
ncbi:MAG: sigma-70 family RNA polymerase sigma factor, partial [Planctomycetes bacterium]|nr:sigma-70 family RNA polymerase sigma factor [Planctomycetota bacterium]